LAGAGIGSAKSASRFQLLSLGSRNRRPKFDILVGSQWTRSVLGAIHEKK
jgi:hypothetical protein